MGDQSTPLSRWLGGDELQAVDPENPDDGYIVVLPRPYFTPRLGKPVAHEPEACLGPDTSTVFSEATSNTGGAKKTLNLDCVWGRKIRPFLGRLGVFSSPTPPGS